MYTCTFDMRERHRRRTYGPATFARFYILGLVFRSRLLASLIITGPTYWTNREIEYI